MTPLYIATAKFDASDGQKWRDYIAWSGLTQLEEVVSIDGILCPTLLPEIKKEYWPHIVNEDFMLQFFVDLDFLVAEAARFERKNLLCVFRDPDGSYEVAGFEFLGYDLVDRENSVSALTNCGGFPGIFENGELSRHGLISDIERAREIRSRLRSAYPAERHADCNVWAVFRRAGDG